MLTTRPWRLTHSCLLCSASRGVYFWRACTSLCSALFISFVMPQHNWSLFRTSTYQSPAINVTILRRSNVRKLWKSLEGKKFCSQQNRNSRRYIFFTRSRLRNLWQLENIKQELWILYYSLDRTVFRGTPTPDKKISKVKIAVRNFKHYFLVFPPPIKIVNFKLSDITCFFLNMAKFKYVGIKQKIQLHSQRN